MPTPRVLRFVLPITVLGTLLIACGGDSSPSSSSGDGVSITSSGALPVATIADRGLDLPPSPTPTEAPPSTATPLPPTATPPTPPLPSPVPQAVAPTATPQPPAPTQSQAPAPPAAPAPAQAGAITFKPETLQQGGMAIVYLNAEATNATLSFGGKQYPMAKEGARWWAIVGVGALAYGGRRAG